MPQQEMSISLLGGDTVDSDSEYRDALPVNMLAIAKEILGAKGYLLMHSGLTLFATGNGIDRGAVWNERLNAHLRVSGQELIVLDAGGSAVSLGAISGLDTVSLPYSFNTQGVLADGRFYLYNADIGLVEITDDDLGNPVDCVWIDGYYFFTDGEYLFHSNLADDPPTDPNDFIDPLQYATAEISPDPTLGVARTVDNKVMVFGRYSIEYFSNIASENFAFSRVRGRALKTGIVGTHCKFELNGFWYILGGRHEGDVSVYVVGVGESTKIASREVDKVIDEYTEAELSTSVLEGRIDDDQEILIVHLPRHTLMFNATVARFAGLEQAWAILKSDTSGNNTWRAKHGIYDPRVTKFVYGDKQNTSIGVLDNSVTTHYNQLVEYIMHTPFVPLEEMSIDEIEIDIIAGFTTTADATAAISLTYDGSHYSKEHWTSYGLPSEYLRRFVLRRLGYVRKFFGLKIRIVSRSRTAFGLLKILFS